MTAAAALCSGCQRAPKAPPPPHRIRLGELIKFNATETVLFVERLLIKRDNRGLSAMSLVCTHQSCMVRNDETTGGKFICPCHGSQFNTDGQVEAGPANRDLPWYELELDSERTLWAWIGKEVSSEWRLPDAESA